MSEVPTSAPRVLVVDDEPSARSALAELLRDEGFDTRCAADGFKALGRLDEWVPDVVLTDLKMPGMDGTALMRKVRERFPDVAVVVMTAFGSIETAVEAIQDGASDFLTKPIQLPHLLVVLRRVLEHRGLRRETERLRQLLAARTNDDDGALVGQSRAFRHVLDLVEQVAGSQVSVLVQGEPGTGKDAVAHALHRRGRRASAPFVHVKCGGLAEDVLRAELFGIVGKSEGRLVEADGGTVFLDEVDRLPAALQMELFEVLQEGQVQAVGGKETRRVDLRVVSATEVDLRRRVDEGAFREDLYYRVAVLTLRLPTLRERREDIPLLATRFLRRYARHYRKGIDGFTERALGVLMGFDWPGNIRQLETCIERAVVMCGGKEIEPRHLPRELMQHMRGVEEAPIVPGSSMREIERHAILRTLEHVGGSTSRAAQILGISPRKIQYRLAEYRDEVHPSGALASVAAR